MRHNRQSTEKTPREHAGIHNSSDEGGNEMKIKIEEFLKAGRFHYLDAVIIRDINTWDYQQFVYDEETQRFTKE